MNDYRIFALNTQTGQNATFLVWTNQDGLDEQIEALQAAGYDSITTYRL